MDVDVLRGLLRVDRADIIAILVGSFSTYEKFFIVFYGSSFTVLADQVDSTLQQNRTCSSLASVVYCTVVYALVLYSTVVVEGAARLIDKRRSTVVYMYSIPVRGYCCTVVQNLYIQGFVQDGSSTSLVQAHQY